MKGVFEKLFLRGEWTIAIKESNSMKYRVIPNLKDVWFADPFIIVQGKNKYIFCEGYEKKRHLGAIYCISLENEIKYVPIIRNNYHMSYPNIFLYDGNYYILPETSEKKTLELYHCLEFPYKWEKDSVLLENINCVDTDIWILDGKLYLLTQEENARKKYFDIYLLDMEKRKIKLVNQIEDSENSQRNAGNPFLGEDSKWYRPCQYSKDKYGENIIIKEIGYINNRYYEKKRGELTISKIKFKDNILNDYERIHTFNQDWDCKVIDVRKSYFDPFLALKKIEEIIYVYYSE